MLRVLLTNDDGIHADGLQTLRRALVALEDVEVAVIAPDANMSATARSITTRRPLWVTEVPFDDGTCGYSCDGTPVDCVRLAALGLLDFEPELIVSGINHGANLGDDITYSGTVAAALEGIMLGLPAGRASIESTAHTLGINLRTLQRRLKLANTSYSELLERVRAQQVSKHLANRRLRLTDVADVLGYSSLGAFTRWYSDHFKETPSAARKRLRSGASD